MNLVHLYVALVAIAWIGAASHLAAAQVTVGTYSIAATWASLLNCNQGLSTYLTPFACDAVTCNPAPMGEHSSSVINSTHAMVCGGYMQNYPGDFIPDCWTYSTTAARFTSKFTDQTLLGRSMAPMWVEDGSTVHIWSGGTTSTADRMDMVTFDVSSPGTTIQSVSYTLGSQSPGARSHLPYFRMNNGTFIFSGFNDTTVAFRDLWYWNDTSRTWSFVSFSRVSGNQGLTNANAINPSTSATPPFIFNAGNLPRSRNEATYTKAAGPASTELFYVFGGNYFTPTQIIFADLWAFNSSSRLWANYSRAPMPELGSTGTVGTFGPSNSPMARTSGNMWIDSKGYVWLFGGQTSAGVINDLWVFSPHLGMWSAVKVDGTAALCTGSLYPASRSRATGWQFGDSFYMYGGVDATLYYYDLWKLEVSVTLASCPPGSEPVGEVCMMCTDYKYSQTGSACIVCPDGTAAPTSTNSSSCNSCSSTQYRNSSMSVCGSCPAGFQPDPTRSFCEPCPAGTYHDGIAGFCAVCPLGQESNTPIADSWFVLDYSHCFLCPSDPAVCTWIHSVFCSSGSYRNSTMSQCGPCDAGNESADDKSSCIPCHVGQYSLSGSMCQYCANSTAPNAGNSSCDPCPPNTFSNFTTLTTVGVCVACPAGFVSTGSACVEAVVCNSSTCSLSCSSDSSATTCNITTDVSIVSGSGDQKTLPIVGQVIVQGNVSLSGAVTITLSTGSKLDVANCLVLSNGATMQVSIDPAATANNTIIASFDKDCSTIPPVTLLGANSTAAEICQHGQPTVATVDSDSGARSTLTLLFVSPPADTCSPSGVAVEGIPITTIGIIVGCIAAALVVLAIVLVTAIPSVRRKVFPYFNRGAPQPSAADVEMTDHSSAPPAAQVEPDLPPSSWIASSAPSHVSS